MAGKTQFDVSIRTLECPNCGGPVISPSLGGRIQCKWCNSHVVVEVREKHPEAGKKLSAAQEVARLSRLRAQVEHPIHGHAYDLEVVPIGLEAVAQAIGRPGSERMIAQEWMRVKDNARAGGADTPQGQQRICWLAIALAESYLRKRDPLRARAALETGLDSLDDHGHRHIIRCRLAVEALRAGDVVAAQGWLDECDPHPELLELDGELRYAQARLALVARKPARALELVGPVGREIPTDPPHEPAFAAIRISAHDQLGNVPQALAQLKSAENRYGHARMRGLVDDLGAPNAIAARVAEQRAASQAAQEQHRKAKRGCRILVAIMVLGLLAGIGGAWGWSYMHPFPYSCGAGSTCKWKNLRENHDGTLVFAGRGAKLVFDGCRIKARKLVDGSEDVTIVIKDSSIATSANVISLGTDAKVTIDNSNVSRKGNGVAIWLDERSKITIDGGELKSDAGIISAKDATEIVITKAKIDNGKGHPAITGGAEAEITLKEVTIDSDAGILRGGRKSRITIEGGSFDNDSEEVAIEAQDQGSIALEGAEVTSDGLVFYGYKRGSIVAKKCKLRSKNVGIETSGKLELFDCALKGDEVAIKARWGADISTRGGSIEGETSIDSTSSVRLDIHDSTKVVGPKASTAR